jgi:hypothetical protein
MALLTTESELQVPGLECERGVHFETFDASRSFAWSDGNGLPEGHLAMLLDRNQVILRQEPWMANAGLLVGDRVVEINDRTRPEWTRRGYFVRVEYAHVDSVIIPNDEKSMCIRVERTVDISKGGGVPTVRALWNADYYTGDSEHIIKAQIGPRAARGLFLALWDNDLFEGTFFLVHLQESFEVRA